KSFPKLSKKKKGITLSGRVTALRGQGGLLFFDFFDGTGRFQGLLKKDGMDENIFSLFNDTVDIGDFVEIEGTLFFTKRKEKTILVRRWRMLSKSLRPLPDKWHGLQDIEERFRHRYLDNLISPEVRARFITGATLITSLRAYLNANNFLEVETPILQTLAGGALAEPFKTHHQALDIDLYLRVAPELYLKKLLVGGFPKVYELSRNFRNEGIDATHNPEFTMLEYYEAYSDADKQMEFSEKMLRTVVKKIWKSGNPTYEGATIDFSKKFTRVTFFDLLRRYALISHPEKATQQELLHKCTQLAVPTNPGDSIDKIMDSIYKKVCRPRLLQTTFIVDYPVEFSPFAKRKTDDC
ncbi:MAG: amino acid--tRNA ligase-related protein, partial [Patescibacteria group bacterium]